MSDIEKQVEDLITPLFLGTSVELVDVNFERRGGDTVLCFTLDKEGGISLDDCEAWSRRFEEKLDQSNLISTHYYLEVSSPGLYRRLKKADDFMRYKGERITVRLFAPLEGQKNFHGELLGTKEDKIVLVDEVSGQRELPLNQIAKANLDPLVDIQ